MNSKLYSIGIEIFFIGFHLKNILEKYSFDIGWKSPKLNQAITFLGMHDLSKAGYQKPKAVTMIILRNMKLIIQLF